jgi:hypothetical protein
MADAASLYDGHHPTLWLVVGAVGALHIAAFLYWCIA